MKILVSVLCSLFIVIMAQGGSYSKTTAGASSTYRSYSTSVPAQCSVTVQLLASVDGSTIIYTGSCANTATASALTIANNGGQNPQVHELEASASVDNSNCAPKSQVKNATYSNQPSGNLYIGHYGTIQHGGYGWVSMTTQANW